MRVLRNRVFVSGSWIEAGTAESDLPAGVKIGNPKAWTEVEDPMRFAVGELGPELFIPSDDGVIIPVAGLNESEDEAGDTLAIPPKTGNGSAKANWVTYAESQRVDVSQCLNKAEIIATLEAAGIPTS